MFYLRRRQRHHPESAPADAPVAAGDQEAAPAHESPTVASVLSRVKRHGDIPLIAEEFPPPGTYSRGTLHRNRRP